MATESTEAQVSPGHHGHGIPTNDASNSLLHNLVTRKFGLVLRQDGVDVRRLQQLRQANVELAGARQHLSHHVTRARSTVCVNNVVKGFHPLVGFILVDIRK